MAAKDALGRRGEEIAARHLQSAGFTIIDRNWRCPAGEVDIVALDTSAGDSPAPAELVFVEVKTRSSVAYGHPLEAITATKLARLRRLAGEWCAEHPEHRRHIRIDAIAVIAPSGGTVTVEHLRRVF